jgi:hypothetical protein
MRVSPSQFVVLAPTTGTTDAIIGFFNKASFLKQQKDFLKIELMAFDFASASLISIK